MKTTLHFILVLFFGLSLQIGFSQSDFKLSPKWDYQREATLHEKINDIIPTTYGYMVAVGETLSKDRQHKEGLFIVLKGEDGSEAIKKPIPKAGDQSFNAVIQNHDGTFTLVGYTKKNKKSGKNAWMVQIDWHGNILADEVLLGKDGIDEAIHDIAINKAGQVLAIASEKSKKSKRREQKAKKNTQVQSE